jgi:hypothetical protein
MAGFIATLAMTIGMYTAPQTGLVQENLVTLLGSLLGPQHPASGSWSWWLGLIMHFINGSLIFPLIYVSLVPWLNGSWWGILLWVLAQVVFMPVVGLGFFSTRALTPLVPVIESLVVHLIYGTIVGAFAGSHVTHKPQPEPAKHVEV